MCRRTVALGLVVVLLSVLAVGGAAVPTAIDDSAPTEDNGTTNGTVEVVFFHLPGCPHCANVEAFLEAHRSEYDFTVRKYNARKQTDRFAQYLRAYEVPRNRWGAVPAVFVGDAYAIGDRPAIDLLERVFQRHATATGPVTTSENPLRQGDSAKEAVGPATLVSLAGLALGDAINPCALAVLVILLTTILTRDPERPDRVLTSGLAFSLAVGVTYSVLGLLLIVGLKSAASAATVGVDGLRRLFGVLAIGFGLVNLKDGLRHGAGGFVSEVPQSWRPAMQRYLTRPLWDHVPVVGGALAGVAVSLFLLPCTGGPYLVAGGILAGLDWHSAIPLLLAYNLVFVAPMVLLTAVVAGGYMRAETVGVWRESHRDTLHLVAGGMLVGLGVLLAVGVI